jgi:2-methylcitrate dehydratase
MWKRFHGGDAMRHAVDACLLASVGAEGALRPFSGKLGFLAKFGVEDDILPALTARLRPGQLTNALAGTNLKRWPVGSRAQSAILSALDARAQLPADARIARVEVEASPGVYHHLVEIREDPYHPTTRETADHSLPYIVGAAVLDGAIATGSFEPDVVVEAKRTAFVAGKVAVTSSEKLAGPDNLSLVRIVTEDGRSFVGAVKPGPGHRNNRFRQSDVDEKLAECATPLLGATGSATLASGLRALETFKSMRDFTTLMAAQG